jgi:nicotinate-nucleotide adenylyltransferase
VSGAPQTYFSKGTGILPTMPTSLSNSHTTCRIGLLGGTFNPPHHAHIALAQAALNQLNLDRVDLMPAGQPWQKAGVTMPSASHRLAMCQLAIRGLAGLGIEPCETERVGNTYTIDTLQALCANNPQTAYTLIIGADQAVRLDTWRDWPKILQLCQLAVVARDNQAVQLPFAVLAAYPTLAAIKPLIMPAMPLSSTAIRAAIAQKQSIKAMLAPLVADYITQHNLYQKPTHLSNI